MALPAIPHNSQSEFARFDIFSLVVFIVKIACATCFEMKESKRVNFICSTCRDPLPSSSSSVDSGAQFDSIKLDDAYGLDSFIPRDCSTPDIPTNEVVHVAEDSTVIVNECNCNRNVKLLNLVLNFPSHYLFASFCQGRTSCYRDKSSTDGSYDWSDEDRNQSKTAEKNGSISAGQRNLLENQAIAVSLNYTR